MTLNHYIPFLLYIYLNEGKVTVENINILMNCVQVEADKCFI